MTTNKGKTLFMGKAPDGSSTAFFLEDVFATVDLEDIFKVESDKPVEVLFYNEHRLRLTQESGKKLMSELRKVSL